ncbi:hypothetical protein GCU60_00565 [Blastococcus saxobsidens]|uniref:Uncharacterized protein n=1 Tax=Blastococcus saxobsidens TaxID=138336 RepID=A0A6L9VXT3_9ACTN|nr:hypothetical protein [Blastococcus saxobsidens]NEK84269.1 hypothetical protein [Blastococcus saxobsidens]
MPWWGWALIVWAAVAVPLAWLVDGAIHEAMHRERPPEADPPDDPSTGA